MQDIGEPTESEVKEDMSRSAASIKGVRLSLPEKEEQEPDTLEEDTEEEQEQEQEQEQERDAKGNEVSLKRTCLEI